MTKRINFKFDVFPRRHYLATNALIFLLLFVHSWLYITYLISTTTFPGIKITKFIIFPTLQDTKICCKDLVFYSIINLDKCTFNSSQRDRLRSCSPLTCLPPVSPVAIHIYPLSGIFYWEYTIEGKITNFIPLEYFPSGVV